LAAATLLLQCAEKIEKLAQHCNRRRRRKSRKRKKKKQTNKDAFGHRLVCLYASKTKLKKIK